MKRQLTGQVTKNMHGIADRTVLGQMGLTAGDAEALSATTESAIERMLANQGGWAHLDMSSDELAIHITKQQQQHTYGTGVSGLIGCDGGLTYGRNYDGTKARPRADWCVHEGVFQTALRAYGSKACLKATRTSVTPNLWQKR
jgi:hypothetical protein